MDQLTASNTNINLHFMCVLNNIKSVYYSLFSIAKRILFLLLLSQTIVLPAQNLVHNFEFNGNLNDSQPTGKVLTIPVDCINSFGVNPNQWNWTATRSPGGGLFLATANLPNPENYTLALDFSFSDVSGKRKILSFGDFFENKGVYFLSGGIDQVNGDIYGFGTLSPNTFYKLILTRNATTKELKTYIIGPSGVLQLLGSLTDTNNDAVPVNISVNNRDFTFFLDDASTNTEYTPSGSVRFIKIWDAPLSESQITTLFPSPLPTITSLSSLSGCQGSSLIINGTNLAGVQTVTIGGTAATVVSATATSVTVTVGSGTTGTVSVTTPSGTATSTEVYTVASGGALGSVCNPFTNVNQVTDATPNGLYYFNLGGNVFETKVEEGWVLVLNDGGAAVSQDLPEVTTLDTNLRGIVSSTALSNLGLVGSVKIKSSNAVLDVESTNATIISRVKAGQTIHQGQADNAINDSWIGASAANLTIDATCTTDRGTSLKTNIIHTCGSGGVGTYWIPSIGVRRVADGDGNVADSNSFGLWVKRAIPPTITSLSATSGFCGSSLTINGTFLTNTQTVTIGGTPATIVSTSANNVTVTVGIGTTGTVSITTDGGTVTSAETFTVSINPADALGSVCNPFTNVNQVTSSTPDGTYYFNLGGTTFQTKVEKGWVLIINDVGAPISQDLQEVTNLDVTIRGIVSNSALANLGDFDNVNIRSSDGIIDVKSNNTTIINRIKAGQTIHQGQADNAINDSWVGASSNNIKDDAFCATSQGSSLKGNIIHTCGSSTGTNWIPNLGFRRINDGQGNVASSVSFGLWVQKITPPTIISLSATSGLCGSSLTINGTFLNNTQTVTIGGTPATIVSTTATSVTVTVGIGTTGTVSVTTDGGTATSTEVFTVTLGGTLGSVCNPFTSVNQVTSSTPDGSYYFSFGGTTIQTKVENGWVLVLNDAGARVNQALQVVTTLDVTTRGILSSSALSSLGDFSGIKVKSSNGVVDVVTNNATLISRLKSNQTLHQGSNDNAINDSWTGVGAVFLTTNATCPSGDGSVLNGSVIHICGPSNTLNWIPNRGVREITDAAGFVGAGISFGLWIKKVDPPTITSLSSLNGCIGSTLVINGTNLATVQVVTVGGTAATVISTTETSVTVKIGNGTTGTVQLTAAGGTVISADTYTVSTASNPAEPLGTGCNPFTKLGQVNSGIATGLYYFNLNGNLFETKVENGWVLVLNDAGTPVSQNLQDVTSLDVTTRGILSSSALSNLGTLASAKIKSSDGVMDVTNDNRIILSKIKSGETLHRGDLNLTDDERWNSFWVGASSSFLTLQANCPTPFGSALKGNIIHTCGSSNGMVWIPSQGLRRISDPQGNVAASVSIGIWVQAFPLPVVTTGIAQNIASETVTLTGDVNPFGYNATISFEYGTTTAYGQTQAATPSSGAGSTSIPVTTNLINLQPLTTYHYRVKANTPVGDAFGEDKTFTTFAAANPGGVSGANLWLKSNEGVTNSGANVTGWVDQTRTNTFTKQGTIGYQTNGINFNPTASFSNGYTTGVLPANRLEGNTDINVVQAFAVYKNATSSPARTTSLFGRFDGNNNVTTGLFLGPTNDNTYVYFELNAIADAYLSFPSSINYDKFNLQTIDVSPIAAPFANAWTNGKNSLVEATSTGGVEYTAIPLTPLIGGTKNPSFFNFNGEVAEIITYNSGLNGVDRAKVESYLAIKYGITLDPSFVNYVNSSGTVLWNDTKYWHDVFGIGKDDASSLNQSQSNSINTGSGDGKGQSGKGNIVLSDPTSLNDGDFLMMGHDNAALTEQTTDLPTNLLGKRRLAREWKVKKTNTPGTYNLSFDTTGLCLSASTAADFKLLVDSDEDGEFIAATTIDAASYANNILYFTGVDLPNNAVFTFLTSPPTIQLTSAVGTDAQTVCTNTALMSIVYTTSKITNAVVTDLPAGVSANFSSNALTISGTPTASGVFNYTIQLSSAQCPPLANVTGTITVTALPNKPSITTSGPTSFCAPGSVVLTSSAATGNQWYKDRVAIDGATGTSYTATDTNTYTVIVTQNGCISQESDLVEVTANIASSAPTLNANGNTVICEGGSVRLHTSSLTGNKWFKNGIEIPGETGSDYNATTTGSYTVETINTAGCVSGLSTPILVTVNPNRIVAPITGADKVCANSSITLVSTTTAGVWSSSNTGIASIDGSGVVTGVSAGTVTITYSEANSSGCVTSVSKTITVIAQPIQPTITASGATSFCSPATVTLSSSATTGNQWYKDGSAITGATDSVYTTAESGSYTVISTIDGCASAESAAMVVTVSVPPVVDPIVGAAVVCAGNTLQLTNATSGGVWSTSSTSIANVDGSGRVTGVSAGTATITFTVTTKFGCATSVSKDITVIASPSKPSITTSGSTSFCAPGSVVLTSSASSGNQWYKEGSAITGATTSSYTAADSGIYTVLVTQNGCVSVESDQVTVTANVTPSVPTLNATGNTIICEGGSVRLHTSSLTDNIWFKDGLVIPGVTGSDYIATTTGTYTVESSNTSGCVSGLSVPIVVTINPNRIVAPITGADRVCANASITLSNATVGGVWSSSNTGIATVDGSGEVTGIIGGTVTITYSASNTSGCVTSVSKTITVTPEPVTPVIATSGPTSFCLPGSVVLSSSATTGNQWYKDGLPIVGATASVYTATDSGTYTVVSTQNGCSSNDSGAVVVRANGLPFLDPITGADVVCTSTTTLLSNTIPRGVWSSSNTGIATIDGSGLLTGISAGRVTITYTFTSRLSGCSSTVSKEITVSTLPSKPSITTSGATSFCAPGSVVLRSSATTGNQWYKDGNAIAGATTNSYTATDSGIYTVIVTQNSCVSVESNQVTVTANATPSVPTLNATGNTVICEGASVRLHTSSPSGNIWFKNGIEILGETGSDYIATTTGTYTVESINTTGCVSGLSVPIVVTVNPNPIVVPITGADRVCANASITLSNATTGGVWSSSNTGIATIDGSGEVTGIIGGTVSISYSVTSSSGCVTSVTKTIMVTQEPVTPVIGTSGPTTFCIPGSVVLSSSATTGNQWYKDGLPIAGATANVYTATDSGSYRVIRTQNGCSSIVSGAVVVQANVVPVLDPITGADVVCTSTTSLLSNTIPRGVWSSSNTGIATIDGSGLLTGISAGRVTITYTFTARLSGCSSSVSKEITVGTLPSKPSISTSGATSFCTPGSVVLRSSASSGNQWYKDGTAIAGATTNSYTATDSGSYSVIVTQNSCVSLESDQVTVSANATPSIPTLNATGNTVICEGASLRLHTSSLTGNKWFKNGIEIPGETGSDYIVTTSGSYTVETINTTGCVSGTSAPILVTVDPNRIVAPITGADRVCANASITLSNATAGGVWSSSNTGIATIDGSGEVTGIIGGTVSISYSVTNSSGCVTSVSKTITVTPEPVTPVIATSGPTSFCIPGSVVLSSSATTGNQWYKNGGPIAGATANVYTATDSGSYTVISTQSGCSSIESAAVVVQANVVPFLDPITGADLVCTSTTTLLSNTFPRGVWSSSNTGIATIDGSGLLTGISAGRVTITYTITSRLSGCSSTVSKEITVTTLPSKPSISTSGATSFCAPGSVVLRSSASSGNQWYKDGAAITGATATTYTATVSGIYTVIVTQNSCVSIESDQVTVTANATPSVPTLNATGNTIICEGKSIRLHTSSPTGNKWFKNGVEIPGETGSDYIATTTGTYTVETINATGCVSGTSAPILVTVNPNKIVASITGADRVCANASITLSNATAGGVWSSSNTGIATVDGSGEVTGIIGGTVTITYSASNTSGCVTSVSKTITVTPEPVTPVIGTSGPTTFCIPGSVVLSSSATTGNQWYKDGLPIVGATASVYTATDSGSYTVISTQSGCSSIESAAVVVQANVVPVLDPITGADVVCTSTTTLLSNTFPRGVWSSSNTGIATIDGSGLLTGISAGRVTITYTFTARLSGCSSSVSKEITVSTLPRKPSVTAASSTSFCAPGSVVLRSSANTGNQWFKEGVAIQGATANNYTATDSGIYTLVVTQNGCVSLESDQVTVTANATPSAPTLNATGNTIICEGGSVRLHTSSLTGNKWFKDGVEIPGETGSDYIATTTGTYTVETINTTGCVSGLSAPILVTVDPNRIVAPIIGADRVCEGSSITLASTTTAGVWSSSNTGIASIDGSGVVTGVSAGTVTITYSASNTSGCTTSVSKTITVIAQPIQPTITASGVTSFCSPATVTLTSSATTGNQWYKDGAAITGATARVYTASDSGSYTVISTINGCSSLESIPVVVTVSMPPVVDPIVGATVVCAGNTIQLSNTILKGVWSTSNTGIANVDASGIVTGVSAGTATITFTVTTKFGCVTSVSKDIIVTALPNKPSITTSGSTSFCAPSSVVLRSSANTGNQWYKEGVAITGATANSYTATNSGIYTVVVTQNGCASLESNQVTVTANASLSVPILNATGNTIICEGASVRLHTSSPSGNIWFNNGVAIPGVTGSDYIATTTGSYTVESSNTSGCVSGTSTPILVTVNPNRIVALITGANTVCANSSTVLSSTTSGGVWSSSNIGVATIDGSGVVTGVSAGTVTITYSASNTSGCTTSVSKTITVIAQPIQPTITVSGATSFCAPDTVVLTSSATTGNQWYKDGTPIVGATAKVFTATDSGFYTVINTLNGCTSQESTAVEVKVSAVPAVDPITGAGVVCAGSSIQLSNTILKGVWSTSNTGIASVDGSGLVTGVSAGTATITFTVITKFGCVSSVSKDITVTALPNKPSITTSGATSFCAPDSVVLRSSANTGNQWYKEGVAIAGATANSYTATNSGIYTVVVTQNGCTSLESNQVTVTANASLSVPTLNATGNTIICEGASVRLHTSSLTGNKWFNNGAAIPGVTGSDYIVTTTGTYTVESSNPSGCVSGLSAPVLVTVNPNRIVAPITGGDTICANSSITLASTTTAGIWSSSNTGIATIDALGVVTGVSAGNVIISYSASNTSGCVTSVTKTITVAAQPIQPIITTTGLSAFCTTGSVVLRSSAPKVNQWYKDGVLISGAIASVYTATTSGSYTVSTSKNNCTSEFSDPVVITATTPIVNPIIGDSAIDLGSSSQLSNTTPRGTWQSSAISIATISASGLVTGLALGNVVISYTVTNSQGCSTTVTKSIAILSLDLVAVNDDYSTTPIDSSKGVVLDVLTNDKENNGPINISDVTVSITDSNGLPGITIDNQGKIIIPQGSAIGSYVLTYSICYALNSSICSSATIAITIKDPCELDNSSSDCDIVVKNAVSPNNDGINDGLTIEKIENYPDNTVEIFNRWGQLVFKTNAYNNTTNVFNGIAEGKGIINKNNELPAGTYFYVIKYKNPISGIVKQKVGYLFISR
ncbi:Gliding motility-associated, C-terminal domain [Flavobacteriaceae bacterium]